MIGFDELFRQDPLSVAVTYRAFEIDAAVAVVCLLMTSAASLLFRRLVRRWAPAALVAGGPAAPRRDGASPSVDRQLPASGRPD